MRRQQRQETHPAQALPQPQHQKMHPTRELEQPVQETHAETTGAGRQKIMSGRTGAIGTEIHGGAPAPGRPGRAAAGSRRPSRHERSR